MREWEATAPAKVILFGEHAVNRSQVALATAVDLRARCVVAPQDDDLFVLRAEGHERCLARREVEALKGVVDDARARDDVDSIQRLAEGDFFAPTCYVLALALDRLPLLGLDITWRSDVPIGSGLGSGAAASSAMIAGLCQAAGVALSAHERARLAWQGDIIAHGGVASGLDSAAATFGGVVRYTVAGGPEPLAVAHPLPMVIGHTGIRANTAEVNGHVRAWLAADATRARLFPAMGAVAERALIALRVGDMAQVGALMDENQALLERLGVSCPEIERLTGAARAAGALGAKLSGSGGGGIVIALTTEDTRGAVARAIEEAGGQAIVTRAAVPGAEAASIDAHQDSIPGTPGRRHA